jgi:hypothetical protein
MKLSWPWGGLEVGQGFFVPCINVGRVRELGLRAAVPLRIKAEGQPAIVRGQYGVWFSRLPDARSRRAPTPRCP